MNERDAEISQITFYLAKEKQTFDSIIDKDTNLNTKKNIKSFDFDIGDAQCRFTYFESVSSKSNPPWLDFVNERLDPESRIRFSSRSVSANGILFVAINNRLLIATFGRSAGSCLDRKELEIDFGIKAAMNMCGNDAIRQTKSQSNTITPTHIDRQVSKPSDAFSFGLNEAEDLRYISAHLKEDKNITLQGRESLTLKIIGKDKLNWDKLIDQCKRFLMEYQAKSYIDLFPNYKNFRPATEEEARLLDDKLIETLRIGNFEKISLSLPEFVSEEEYSFSYTDNKKRDNFIYSFLDVKQLSEHLELSTLSIQSLKNRKVFAYSPIEDRVLSYKKWYIYNCIGFEAKLGDSYFLLNDGQWSEVDKEFYLEISDFISHTLRVEPCENIFKGINISDNAAKRNQEKIFNDQVCAIKSTAIKFDRAKLKIGNGRKDKEFCDVLDMLEDGSIRIINCKPLKDASSLNYLFSQTKFYSEAFLRDATFLKEIRKHIESSTSPIKDKYLNYIADKIEELHGQKYLICLWLLYDQSQPIPSKENIPLISQYELKLMHDHLRRVYKFKEIVLRFVPVQITNYKTSKRSKAA